MSINPGDIPEELIDPVDRELYRQAHDGSNYPNIQTSEVLNQLYEKCRNNVKICDSKTLDEAKATLNNTIKMSFLHFVAQICEKQRILSRFLLSDL
jgi:hypothetical protein